MILSKACSRQKNRQAIVVERLGVDAVVLVYSEWGIDSGKFVPTMKALTKNCFAMYSKDGRKLFYARKDMRGAKVIGGAFRRHSH